MDDLAALARHQLAANRFLVLGTVDPDGRPRVSPVWFSLVDHRDLYWLSAPEAHHSCNVASRPEISAVAYDSAGDPATGQAVYLEATAERVPDDELDAACTAAFADVDDALSFTPTTLEEQPFVLYRARLTRVEVHVRGSDPEHGTGIDRRVAVEL
ncbi:nitroimidazol reductase NimA-like FMN-containing flavoprotein (pyridoxamine 5'-phosphate oxidase superfamily) [Marmoricola sp. OAE513]|uniref:pyridoxamine 5'-phosphate oxidase family protein n=1 Tax=Marmoricola sp. OAE513 TaxID=2817894 RepID=UPI001AE6A439